MGFFSRANTLKATSKFDHSLLPRYSAAQLKSNRDALYDNFSYNNWNKLDRQEKLQCLQALENDFAFQQGRPALPVRTTSEVCYGYYSPYNNALYVNENLLDHGNFHSVVDADHPSMSDANMQLFDTVAHEGYHGYQNYSMKHPEIHADKHQLSEWAMNEGRYYECSKENGDKYLIQPQERDAWEYGSSKTKEAFEGIEARNGAEPGIIDYEMMVLENSYSEALTRAEAQNPNILTDMSNEMSAECSSKGISYDYEDPNVVPTMVEDKDGYKEKQEEIIGEENRQNNESNSDAIDENDYKDINQENHEKPNETEQSDVNDDIKDIEDEQMRNWDKDPSLGADDSPMISNDNNDNQWIQLMEETPSYSEHMEQMKSEESEVNQEHNVSEVEPQETYFDDSQDKQMSDLAANSDGEIAERSVEEEEQASDLTEGANESQAEESTEQEEKPSDLTEGPDESTGEESAEQEEQANDLTEGVDAESIQKDEKDEGYSEDNESDESQSYGY